MKNRKLYLLVLGLAGLLSANCARATNPLITDQFTADPTARVFEGQMYLYPSHDIPYSPGRGRTNWFIMQDYHAFSSSNLMDWTDHGMIVSQTNVDWVNPTGYSMWAPDCVFKNGKYYFYFPTTAKERGGFRIGVAIADQPYGPFKAEAKPIEGVRGIDPCVLLDKDGSAYLFWAGGRISVAKLKDNLLELDSKPQVVTNLPAKGLIEGAFAFERNGVYYLTYPHAEATNGERLEYSISSSPMGPYQPAGIILDESADGCWTVHQSIVEYQGQWYLFYHDKDLSPNFDKNRSVRADYLYFNDDGTIRKVVPTLRGVGIVDAKSKIQIDRYSAISQEGASVSFLEPTNTFAGWKTSFTGSNAWVRFDKVDFGNGRLKSANVMAMAPAKSRVQIRLDKADGSGAGQGENREDAKLETRQIQVGECSDRCP